MYLLTHVDIYVYTDVCIFFIHNIISFTDWVKGNSFVHEDCFHGLLYRVQQLKSINMISSLADV
jgi:hypothetical protein